MTASSRVVPVARALGRAHRATLLWAAAIFTAIFVVLGLVLSFVVRTQVDAWDVAGYGPRYYLMAIGALVPAVALPAYVRVGVTRREFLLGGALFLGGLAVAAAIVMAVSFLAGGLVFDVAGWAADRSSRSGSGVAAQVPLVVVEYSLVFLAHLVSGWLIGTGFARLHGWGVLTLVPGLVPALAVDAVLASGWVEGVLARFGVPGAAWPVAIGLATVVIAAAWGAAWLAVRRMPVAVR